MITYIRCKNTNSCGYDGISSNMLKNALSNTLCQQLCTFINAMFTFKHIPSNFSTSIIVPLIKNKNIKKFLVSNFRPLSISNAFAQIFEKIILDRTPQLLETDTNQFGYKKRIWYFNNTAVVHFIRTNSLTQR